MSPLAMVFIRAIASHKALLWCYIGHRMKYSHRKEREMLYVTHHYCDVDLYIFIYAHMIYIVSATVRGGGGVYIMFFHSCKDRDFVFVQGNLAKSWGCVDFSFYYFSLGSHLINTMKGFNYCKREKLFLKTQVRLDKSSMLNYIPLSGKKVS